MAGKFYNRRNLDFTLFEVMKVEKLLRLPYYQDHDKDTLDMTIDAAHQVAHELLYPYFEELDRNEPKFTDGRIHSHPILKKFMETFGKGGWISGSFPYEVGGQQLPLSIWYATSFIFAAANPPANAQRGLTASAANLILSFGSKSLHNEYIQPMLEGKWQGTMALTEPQAGSSLSDITTSANKDDSGIYKIKGQKIFISSGDYDGIENIIHLMLARIEGAPAGVKGISLFVVPKFRMDGIGQLVDNDVASTGTFHKMGMKGWPLANLTMGDNQNCYGYLVGEENKGLSYMFQMMNTSRIGVGLTATGISSAAFCASLDYARNRPQGRKIDSKDLTSPQIPIIKHADVKRMLLFQKSIVEGSLSLLLQCTLYADHWKRFSDVGKMDDAEESFLLLDLLTPIAKSFPSEWGDKSVAAGIQIMGGSGYVTDYPLEQHYRNQKISSIYEGTTGIQAMDLLGRKIPMQKGKGFKLFLRELGSICRQATNISRLEKRSKSLERAVEKLQNITTHLAGVSEKEGNESYLSDATLYLRAFGIVTIAWQWLKQGIAAENAIDGGASGKDLDFYKGKLFTMDYFFEYEVPKIDGLLTRLKSTERLTVEMEDKFFD